MRHFGFGFQGLCGLGSVSEVGSLEAFCSSV